MCEKMNGIIDEVVKAVKEKVQTGTVVEVVKIKKNTGVEETGITIKNPLKSVGPTFYCDDKMLGGIENGETTVDEVAKEIVSVAMNECPEEEEVKGIVTKEYILSKVKYQLVNKEMNEGLLADVPHKDFMDLAVIYRCITKEGREGVSSYIIHNGLMVSHGISKEELDEAAARNTKEAGYKTVPMLAMMAEITGMSEMEFGDDPTGMYVYTNKCMNNGATVMLYTQFFEEIAEKQNDDLFIIPSSIHEVLSVPVDGKDKEYVKNMVSEVNASVVEMEERLSDTVYRYIRDEKRLVVA